MREPKRTAEEQKEWERQRQAALDFGTRVMFGLEPDPWTEAEAKQSEAER